MKSIFSLLVAILVLALLSVPAPAATDAGLEWDIDTTISSAAGFDTILAANDSSTIMTARTSFGKGNRINYGGWTYYVALGRITGTSKDTANLCIAVDAYDFNDSLIGRAYSDTSADRSECYFFTLPIGLGDAKTGHAFIGDKYRLKIKNVGTGTTTEQTIINGISIRKSRPVNMLRNVGR